MASGVVPITSAVAWIKASLSSISTLAPFPVVKNDFRRVVALKNARGDVKHGWKRESRIFPELVVTCVNCYFRQGVNAPVFVPYCFYIHNLAGSIVAFAIAALHCSNKDEANP